MEDTQAVLKDEKSSDVLERMLKRDCLKGSHGLKDLSCVGQRMHQIKNVIKPSKVFAGMLGKERNQV